ncbi:uncharacterized protein LOC135389080 [Ornithodoros turicata]|uniref:uncharacterized protein LOC135389080 n=1 Tax=Ornithodoros turicata TaxID=34597 RepID=UPI003139B7E9
MKNCARPLKKHLEVIATKIVSTYPESFKDVLDGQVVGTGYDSVLQQLITRVENNLRAKENTGGTANQTSPDASSNQNKRKQPSYLYGGAQTERQPLSNDEEVILEQTKRELKRMHATYGDREEVVRLMIATYPLQRHDIVTKKLCSVQLKEEWPYLFEAFGLFSNFKELHGIDIELVMENNLQCRTPKLLKFFEVAKLTCPTFSYIFNDLKSSTLPKPQAESLAVVLLCIKFFQEDEHSFILTKEECTSRTDAEKDLPLTPCIVAFGETLWTTTEYKLSIDGKLVIDGVRTFRTALALWFSTYHCLHIIYPKQLMATLDFIQRCLAAINPDRAGVIKKRTSVHPKVLRLVEKLAGQEWNI